MQLLTSIFRHLAFSGNVQPHRYLQSKTFEALENWIQEKRYLEGDKSMTKVAEEMGVSSDDLAYFCHNRLKTNFLTWRKELRIMEAKRLIRENPEIPIYLVAKRVGINSKANFRRQFVEVTGVTPTKWRSRFLKHSGKK